ncbi:hypothetical protein NST11_18975 [Caldifermentibacillus hisashii]|uniref:hypothetical protein n=1 Tax=Caldifermentibacillus hisashii TaxID=996558 RepID=UPI0031B7CC30
MKKEFIIQRLSNIFYDMTLSDDEVADKMFEILLNNKASVDVDQTLKHAKELLKEWNEIEQNAGIYVDIIQDTLNLKRFKKMVGIGFCKECLARIFLDEEFYIYNNELLCKECEENINEN